MHNFSIKHLKSESKNTSKRYSALSNKTHPLCPGMVQQIYVDEYNLPYKQIEDKKPHDCIISFTKVI